jgi:hypothetical protein
LFAKPTANEGSLVKLCPLIARRASPTAKLQPAVENKQNNMRCGNTVIAPLRNQDCLFLKGRAWPRALVFDSLQFARENMKRLKLWLLVALPLVGSFVGCSRVYTTAPVAPDSIRKSFEPGPETTKGKPSACIKWVHGSGRTSKPLRKAVRISDPEAVVVNREKNFQADNEDHPE